jgi:NAD(P)H-dependent flavin oxidoreductase YrpB (nitropropane dioxygenase family)
MVATRMLPADDIALPLHAAVRRDPPPPVALPPAPKLTRAAVEGFVADGRRLLIQGGMGLHASDGLAGPVAAAPSRRFVPVGTVSAVEKTEAGLIAEIRRARSRAPFGYVGVNLMAALNRDDFEAMARTALAEGVSFVVQGAGISREILRWCREANTPFVGIVSSGRLAKMYEKWGADFLVAEGSDAGGHIGDIGEELPDLLAEVLAATRLPVVAAGGIVGADLGRYLEAGAAGVQLATRFLACKDGDAHPAFKEMHLGKTADDVVVITSTVKGMKARAIRNPFTEALAAGRPFPPVAKAWFFGREGFRGRRKSCIECLAAGLCVARESGFQESFCITDALLRAAVLGDKEHGLFYSGQSVTRIPEKDVAELKPADELIATLEAELEAWEGARAAAR